MLKLNVEQSVEQALLLKIDLMRKGYYEDEAEEVMLDLLAPAENMHNTVGRKSPISEQMYSKILNDLRG